MGKRPLKLVLLHGYAESPSKVWLPWLHKQAEALGLSVEAPELPNPLRPTYGSWMRSVRRSAERWDRWTIVVGHSLGGVLALRALDQADTKVRAVVTVSTPFAATVTVKELIGFFDHSIDWRKLRRRAKRFVTIHSKNDPLVPYDHARRYQEILGSRVVLTAKDSHFIGKRAPAVWGEIKRIAEGE